MSDKKLWKVMSFSKTEGNRISKSLSYGDALARFSKFKHELTEPGREGDTLYMVQVLEVAVGRSSINTADDVIEIEAPTWLSGLNDNGPFDKVAAKR